MINRYLPIILLVLASLSTQVVAQPYTVTTERAEYIELTDPDFLLRDTSSLWNEAEGYLYANTDFIFPARGFSYDVMQHHAILYYGGGYIELFSDSASVSFCFMPNIRRRGREEIAEFSYKTVNDTDHGTVWKFQWKNFRPRNGSKNDYMNFQGWLYENGIIDIRIGGYKGDADAFSSDSTGPEIFFGEHRYSPPYGWSTWYLVGSPSSPRLENVGNKMESAPDSGTVIRLTPSTSSVRKKPLPDAVQIYESSGRLHVTSLNEPAALRITNILGQTVLTSEIEPHATVDIHHLSAGVYHGACLSGDRVIASQMIIKR